MQQESDLTAYQAYQANVRRSEALQSDIIRGSKAGEPLASLLLKAAEAISLMTGSDAFRDEVERALVNIYGTALGDEGARAMELGAVEARLERIRAAYEASEDEEQRHELDLAIRAHEKRRQALRGETGQEGG